MRDGWVDYKFKDVATAIKGKLPKSKNEDGIGVPYLTASYLRSSQPDYWIENLEGAITAEDGDCLILWDGAGAGDLFSARRGVVSSTMAVVTTQNSKILREFLTLFISSKADYIKETCRGTTVPHVSPDAIANMDLKIPPLPEQKRIVDLISSVDSYIEALQQQLESAKKSRNAVLHELMYSDPNLTEVSLFEVCEFINGKAHEKNIDKHGKFIVINSKFISSNGQVKKYSNKQFCPAIKDDITMVMSDLPNGKALGKCFYVSKDLTFTVNQRVCILRAKSIKPEYLFLLLDRNPYFLSFDNGVSQTNLSNRVFSDFKVKINSSQKHQAYIVDLASNFDYVIRNSQIALVKASKLKESLLSDLLSGKYEIPASYDKVIGAA